MKIARVLEVGGDEVEELVGENQEGHCLRVAGKSSGRGLGVGGR